MSTLAFASPAVKVVGANGQISLGKQYAGRQVLVEEREAGVWLIRTATVVPDNEQWLREDSALRDLRRALDWAQAHAATDVGVADVLERLAKSDGSAQ